MSYTSETSGVRHLLARYCIGSGVDIGYGGDPIVPSAICFDMERPYADVGESPQHLSGTAYSLPFKDEVLSYVYSSHLIEDFEYEAQQALMDEWGRVVKTGGLIIICAPDEVRYRAHCEKTGQSINCAHVNTDYSLENFKARVLKLLGLEVFEVVMERDHVGLNDYSWCIVLEKK